MKNNLFRKLMVVLLVITTVVGVTGCGEFDINKESQEMAKELMASVKDPSISSIGGDWVVKGVAESGLNGDEVESYFATYAANVEKLVKEKKGNIDEVYITTYARVIIVMESIGKDSKNIAGYDLTAYLDDYEKITNQGINAASFALIAANNANVKLKNEEKYIDFITKELEEKDLFNKLNMTDYCSMAMEGLSFYKDKADVRECIEKCLNAISKAQGEDGSLGNCESTAEAIIAITCTGIDPLTDERFIKDGKTLVDGLMAYKMKGGYVHVMTENGKVNAMASEKALLALSAVRLFNEGESFY